MDFFGGFKAGKLKPQLKMAVHRLQISSNKKVAQIKNQKRDIAKLLGEKPNPKEEKARIRAEALIREDHTVEAYEILQLNCELLAERIKLIASEKQCPPDMVSVVSTVIWASNRVDIPEFIEIRKQFKSKYGKEFYQEAMTNVEAVNGRVYTKLSVQPPPALLVQTYLEKIAEEFSVDWKPQMPLEPEDMALPMKAPVGTSIPAATASGYSNAMPQPPLDEDITVNMQPPSKNRKQPPATNPGAYSVPYPAPDEKAAMPTATVGLPVAPPFADHDSDDEVDIYVPKSFRNDEGEELNGGLVIPSAPTGHVKPSAPGENDDDDDEGDGYTGESFRDLQARFANLKK